MIGGEGDEGGKGRGVSGRDSKGREGDRGGGRWVKGSRVMMERGGEDDRRERERKKYHYHFCFIILHFLSFPLFFWGGMTTTEVDDNREGREGVRKKSYHRFYGAIFSTFTSIIIHLVPFIFLSSSSSTHQAVEGGVDGAVDGTQLEPSAVYLEQQAEQEQQGGQEKQQVPHANPATTNRTHTEPLPAASPSTTFFNKRQILHVETR